MIKGKTKDELEKMISRMTLDGSPKSFQKVWGALKVYMPKEFGLTGSTINNQGYTLSNLLFEDSDESGRTKKKSGRIEQTTAIDIDPMTQGLLGYYQDKLIDRYYNSYSMIMTLFG